MESRPAIAESGSRAISVPTTIETAGTASAVLASRWCSWRLASSHGVISSPQYVWALFTQPVTAAFGVSLAQAADHLLDPDRGPDVPVSVAGRARGPVRPAASAVRRHGGNRTQLGARLAGASLGPSTSPTACSAASAPASSTSAWSAIWSSGFPTSRGLATGLVAAGYGMGALLFTFPVAIVMTRSGYQDAMWMFGSFFGLVGLLAAQGLRRPDRHGRGLDALAGRAVITHRRPPAGDAAHAGLLADVRS